MRRRTVLQLPLVLGVAASSMAAVGRTALAQVPADIHIATMSAEEVWHNIRRADGSWDGFAVLDRSSSQFTKRNMASAVVNGEEVLAYQSFHSPLAMKTYIRTRHADGTWSLEIHSSLSARDTALAAVAGELHMVQRNVSIAAMDHRIRRAGGDWTSLTSVPIPPRSTGASLTGAGDECRLMVLDEDGKTMHPYVRRVDGTWTSPGPISFEPPAGTVLTNVQIAQVGTQLHVIALTSGGLLFHETRGPDNTGSGFRNVYDEVGYPGDVAKFSATASGERLHIAIITKTSDLLHTIRYETGAWQRLGHLGKAPGTNPLPDVTIAGAGV